MLFWRTQAVEIERYPANGNEPYWFDVNDMYRDKKRNTPKITSKHRFPEKPTPDHKTFGPTNSRIFAKIYIQ
jgi:hypothetical protein